MSISDGETRSRSEEVEVKYRLAGSTDHEQLRQILRKLGAAWRGVRRENNTLFDNEASELRTRGIVVRVRTVDDSGECALTIKGPTSYDGGVKSRREVEVHTKDTEALHEVLELLGYRPWITYAKVRESWQTGEAEVSLDTLDIGHFCEVEGPRAAIEEASRLLGLSSATAELAGYANLVERHRQQA